jgi:predicted dinucleotide-binding enzyme
LAEWKTQNPTGSTGTFAAAAAFGELVVLAVKGGAAMDALRLAGARNLAGKTVVDACNPIADAPPVNGVLKFFTNHDESLMEKLQHEFAGGKPTMFICGNSEAAKKSVVAILDQFGWETADMGTVEAARAIEPLCMLWCIPGFRSNDWTHAFKMLKK